MPRVALALLIIGLVVVAAYLLRLPANQHDQTEAEEEQLELQLEALPNVSSASVATAAGSASIELETELANEQEYVDLVHDVASTWQQSPLGARKTLSLTASPEGEMQFARIDVDDLDRVLAAAHIAYAFGPDNPAELRTGQQLAGEVSFTISVADESLVEATRTQLIAMVVEADLAYRPDALEVVVDAKTGG